MVKVIGIDPGLADTGVGIVSGEGMRIYGYSFGSISTSPRDSLAHRLNEIYESVADILGEERPDMMVVEDVFSLGRFPVSGITLGEVCGVVLLAAFQAGVNAIKVPVREVKQAVTGNGNAGKKQVSEAVRHFLGHEGPISPDHASDALALAIMGLLRYDSLS